MSRTAPGRSAESSAGPGVDRLLRRFEADWHAAPEDARPDLAAYLPDGRGRDEALLALARADLVLRWSARERVRAESYRQRFPELAGEALVSLIYEEYCVREEAGEAPSPIEYTARFPELAELLRPVFSIHGLFGSGTATGVPGGETRAADRAFPSAGQSIAGFRLVEELGRGAFARVFLAQEIRLADRLVALKVARAASREPQTLARLQHTHIVPIYSYRTDPATGLHLLCMPYLGRATLAQLLADGALRDARSGADLLAALDRLVLPTGEPVAASSLRRTLSVRPYAGAVAWWGARLAEALQHAHERGIWHGDIKPSNVLVTEDGLPMLLDFNLAQEVRTGASGVAPAVLGGTVAYMAPEQLEALASGEAEHAEGRSDLFALGVVLFEALAPGLRPFPVPTGSLSLREALRWAAEERRLGAPQLRRLCPETPAALSAIVDRCLAPRPEHRYASAAELAADLQAFADDRPLRHAREPLASRSVRWARRNRRPLAMLAPISLAVAVSAVTVARDQLASIRRTAEVRHWLVEASHSAEADALDRAVDQFAAAGRLAAPDVRLQPLRDQARRGERLARRSRAARAAVDDLLRNADRLRFALLGFGSSPRSAVRDVEAELGKFGVPRDAGWRGSGALDLLDEGRRERFFEETDVLLFLWVVALDHDRARSAETARWARALCDAAPGSATAPGPWRALRARFEETGAPAARSDGKGGPDTRETSARACFEWGVLGMLRQDPGEAIAWLRKAIAIRPSDYWAQFYLGYCFNVAGRPQKALEHYQAAIALRPELPWPYFNRARVLRDQGELDAAREDLDAAIARQRSRGPEFVEARLESGLVRQLQGDASGARAAYDAVIASGPAAYARAARLNRAKLEIDEGAPAAALADFEALLQADPEDRAARRGRALFQLRLGRAAEAESDLSRLIQGAPQPDPELFAHRALARLVLGRIGEAEKDAEAAWDRRPSPSFERLRARIALAAGRDRDLERTTDPEQIGLLPLGGAALSADLRAAIRRLERAASAAGPGAMLARRSRAVLLAALGDRAAVPEADRAVDLAPFSAETLRVRARIRRRFGDRRAALVDVERSLALEPDDLGSLVLKGSLLTELGDAAAGLRVLDRALLRGAPGSVRVARAVALEALGRSEAASDEWSLAIASDPEDPRLYLGRAEASIGLKRWDRACADLEQAADWAAGRPELLARAATLYAACLKARPERSARAAALGLKAWDAWLGPPARPADGSRPPSR